MSSSFVNGIVTLPLFTKTSSQMHFTREVESFSKNKIAEGFFLCAIYLSQLKACLKCRFLKRRHSHAINFIDPIKIICGTTKEINTDKVQKTFFAASNILWFSCSYFEWHMSEDNYNARQKGFQWNLISMDTLATGNDNSTIISLAPTTRKFWVLEWKLGPLQNPTECTDELVKYKHGWGVLCWENRRGNEDISLALSGTIHLVWFHPKPL